MNKIIIIVKDGKVTDVFSKEDCNVEVVDLDINNDYEVKENIEILTDIINNPSEYKWVY